MTKRHVHCDVIKAWADGAQIQWKSKHASVWYDCDETEPPEWHDDLNYRVKPEPVHDGVVYSVVGFQDGVMTCGYVSTFIMNHRHNVRFVFDGESGELKEVEVLK